jgi:hypothetical protein
MVSRPDEPIPGGLGADEGDIPSEDIPDIPEPLEAPVDLPDSGDLLDPDDE